MPYKGEIERFHGSLATLADLVVFVALGLTVSIGGLSGRVWGEGIALALVLALLARPLVVVGTLATAHLRQTERAFIAWAGLKGAVPIKLAAFRRARRSNGRRPRVRHRFRRPACPHCGRQIYEPSDRRRRY